MCHVWSTSWAVSTCVYLDLYYGGCVVGGKSMHQAIPYPVTLLLMAILPLGVCFNPPDQVRTCKSAEI